MKESEFNPLQRDLARGPQAGPHPDSDLLTAFAEGGLLKGERRQVMAHLASCTYCREVLSAAAGAMSDSEAGLQPTLLRRAEGRPFGVWLPWAAVAAGAMIIISTVLLVRQSAVFQQPPTVAKVEPPPLAEREPSAPEAERLAPPSPSKTKSAPSYAAKTVAPANAVTSQQAEFSQGLGAMDALREAPVKSEASAQQDQLVKREEASQTESSTVAGAAADKVMANAAPRGVIAPAAAGQSFSNSKALGGYSRATMQAEAHPLWRIDDKGQAQRSFGEGTWQPVLPNESSRMFVVSVIRGEVWVGGENSRLYRSRDNGATWSAVALPEKNGQAHTITRIRFESPKQGAVEADDGTRWTTADGGITWN